MHVSKKTKWALSGAFIVIVIIGFAVWRHEKTKIPAFPINSADTITSWNFKGGYTDNSTLVAQANADIAHLQSLLGKGEYDDYDLYDGIANDYDLLGNGQAAYQNYNRAIALFPNIGLAYTNLAHLMTELHAYYTAADAYAKAVTVEPGQLVYQTDRISFLTQYLPNDNTAILAALTDASNQFGDNASVLVIEAQWLANEGRYADAIKAYQKAAQLSTPDRQAIINAEIARLEAKQ